MVKSRSGYPSLESRPRWASLSSPCSCAEKGFQSPVALALRREPRARPLTRAFIMCSWFILAARQGTHSFLTWTENACLSILGLWHLMPSCDYARRMDSPVMAPVTSPREQSPGRDTNPSKITEEGGSRERQLGLQGSSVGLLLGVHICFRVVERTRVLLMDHLLLREDNTGLSIFFLSHVTTVLHTRLWNAYLHVSLQLFSH